MKHILIALCVIGVCLVFYPQVWWFFHPDVTEMQLFHKWWWMFLLGGILIGPGCLIVLGEKK